MTLLERLINWNRATKNDGDLFFAEFDRLYTNCQTLKTGVETETADRQQADGSLQTAIDGKRSILDSYSKTETDTALLGKRDVSDSYSQTEIDNALSGKISSTEKGVPNGVANLNSNGLIPASLIPDKSKIKVIADIAERDSQYTPPMDNEGNVVDGYLILVMDASDDPTVGSGWASYCWNASGSAWFKTNEGESIEGIIDWVNVQNKPTDFTPSAHIHAIADVSNLQSELNSKSNTGHAHTKSEITDFPNIPIIESGVYTPTMYLLYNVTSVICNSAHYIRVGNVVSVSLRLKIGAGNLSATNFMFSATLPTASTNTDPKGIIKIQSQKLVGNTFQHTLTPGVEDIVAFNVESMNGTGFQFPNASGFAMFQYIIN